MNDILEQQLAKVLEKALEVAEQTGEFVIGQAPELLREFYTWHLVDNIMGVLYSFALILACYKLIMFVGRKLEWDWEDELAIPVTAFITGIISLICSYWFFWSIGQILKITITPKLYLIEYFIR